MGSGTTAKIAHLLKRKWLGSEISKEYVEIAGERLKEHTMNNLFAAI
jgi:site-specific DNA-methyltransferase (adenine-specific)